MTAVSETGRQGRKSVLVVVVIVVLLVSIFAGLDVTGHFGQPNTRFRTMAETSHALELDWRFIEAEKGLSYQFDSNDSGLLPSPEIVDGVFTTVGNFFFYAYGNEVVSICGLLQSRNTIGEIEVRVPFTESNGYDIRSIVIYRYSPPFVYACQVPAAAKIDASLLEFHVSVNYSGSWTGFYGYSENSSASHVYSTPWSGQGPTTITVTGEGDVYHGVFVCVGVQKSDGGRGDITLKLVSYSGDIATNSTASSGLVTLCGGTSIIFPE